MTDCACVSCLMVLVCCVAGIIISLKHYKPSEVPDHGVWWNTIASERNSDPSGMAWRIQGLLGVQISGQPQHTTTLGTESMPWHEDHRILGKRSPEQTEHNSGASVFALNDPTLVSKQQIIKR